MSWANLVSSSSSTTSPPPVKPTPVNVDDLSAYLEGGWDKSTALRLPEGMKNSNNNCFANAIIQSLWAIDGFTSAIVRGATLVSPTTPVWSILTTLRTTQSIGASQVAVASLIELFCDQDCTRVPGDQQDASEFLGFVLDSLHEEFLHMKKVLPVSTSIPVPPEEQGWNVVAKNQKVQYVQAALEFDSTPVSILFGGKLKLVLSKKGMPGSISYQPFYSLSLDLETSRGVPIKSIDAALSAYMSPISLSGVRNDSGKVVAASRRTELSSLGRVVVMHLKRFQYSVKHGTMAKLSHIVSYPHKLLLGNDSLRLSAVVCHHGPRAVRGHYTAVVRYGDNWFEIDDDNISRVTKVLDNKNAYMLYYSVE